MEDLVMSAETREIIKFPNHVHIKEVKFTNEMNDEFSWIADFHNGTWDIPSYDSRHFKTWKTLNGAKRNFIKKWLK